MLKNVGRSRRGQRGQISNLKCIELKGCRKDLENDYGTRILVYR